MKNIIIIGARGYKANYGGWETFVTNLIQNYQDQNVQFHVPELTKKKQEKNQIIEKDKVSCLQIYSPNMGFATMFIYAIKALFKINKYIKKQKLENVTIYILGCRMGPLYPFLVHPLRKRKIPIYLNPDGLEWKREKWSWWIKQCFKISERFMVKYSNGIICDSRAIKDYVDTKYEKYKKKTYFIAYGAYLQKKVLKNKHVEELFKKFKIQENNYYLIVGRFVPENNYELIIEEFMKSNTNRDLVIVSNVEENKFYHDLKVKTNFLKDKRIKFIGSVYEKESIIYLRQNAYAYIHGHSAGGTNPSLLEALANTKINILYNAIYNVEVGKLSSLYFSKKENDLKRIIEMADQFDEKTIKKYEKMAKDRIKSEYTWNYIVEQYKKIW